MKRKLYRILLGVLLCVCVYACSSTHVIYATSIEELEDSIQQNQNAIKAAESQKNQLQSSLTDVKAVIAELEKTKSDLNAYVSQMDASLDEITNRLAQIETLVQEKEEEIEQIKEKLAEAEKTADEQYVSMKKRIQFIYEKGNTYYFEILFQSGSFGDMLNKADYIEQLSAYEKKQLEKYQAVIQEVSTFKESLEAEQELLAEAHKAAEEEQASLEVLIGEKEQQISVYQSDINNQAAVVAEYEADIAAQNETIQALEAAVELQKAQLNEARKYDGGAFIWPCPNYKRISDDYGTRMHPTLKVEKFHNGIDMAAPSGSPILAAYNGTVVAASYSSSMGNYVMIDHGDSLYTIYMHASALYVSQGQTVARGDTIAAVGSTGRSTGPHLHFGVRKNGQYVSPWSYIS